VTPQEQKMAEQLVQAMVADWRPEEYRDTYHDDVLALIEEKIKSGTVTVRGEAEPQEGGEVVDIMALLKRSGEARRPASAEGAG